MVISCDKSSRIFLCVRLPHSTGKVEQKIHQSLATTDYRLQRPLNNNEKSSTFNMYLGYTSARAYYPLLPTQATSGLTKHTNIPHIQGGMDLCDDDLTWKAP